MFDDAGFSALVLTEKFLTFFCPQSSENSFLVSGSSEPIKMLMPDERQWLNAYHAEVYEKVSPYLNDAERTWLKQATRAI